MHNIKYQEINQEVIDTLISIIQLDSTESNEESMFTNVHFKLKEQVQPFNGDALCIKLPYDSGIRERKVTFIIDSNANQYVEDELLIYKQ